ncbi:VOC family protein [Streptomyces longispororuber]|uniref:VOC family protein n=1 Tax=Streptomyces longispororuber TaxID=68230 RepID=UPI00210C6C1A|nr:VOC family protein [Streptomyces longispororuber]MCQ4209678.1 VOC family protein [Streptomyces longispororuber]
MSDYYNAFEMSPVPDPGPDAVPPELFRGIYGMPAFVTIPTDDLAASVDFWTRGLGFFELFGIPGRLVHLRRWAFQDVLLVTGASAPETAPAISVSFACVLGQVDALVEACRAVRPDSVDGPRDTPWNTRDVEVITPENARIVFTAAKPYDPAGEEARNLAAIGITGPDSGPGDNVAHA